jgi:DnaD/phage-associated family protein
MARRRMIDPNFWASQDVRKLTYRQRLLAIGLFSIADDEGRGIAHPAYIRSQVFPYDDISVREIAEDMEALQKHLSIVFYTASDDQYYAWLNWEKWQNVQKPQKSLIPPPPESVENDSGVGRESVENDSRIIPESFSPKGKERKGIYKGKEGGKEVENDSGMILECPPLKIFQNKTEALGYFVTSEDKQLIEELEKIHGADLLIEAIETAFQRKKKPSAKYIEGILRSWKKSGLHTVSDVRRAEGAGGNNGALATLDKMLEEVKHEQRGHNKDPSLLNGYIPDRPG